MGIGPPRCGGAVIDVDLNYGVARFHALLHALGIGRGRVITVDGGIGIHANTIAVLPAKELPQGQAGDLTVKVPQGQFDTGQGDDDAAARGAVASEPSVD